jgi:ATP-dependent 26S proteasome regulatory subunit
MRGENKNWKSELISKRLTETSTTIIVESSDPKRVEELEEFLKLPEISRVMNLRGERGEPLTPRLLAVDPWEGVVDLRTNEPIKGDEIFGGRDLASSMRTLDGLLKRGCTVALIKNITSERDAQVISPALQNWSYHPLLLRNRSTVVVVTSSSLLFDDHTRRRCIVIEPPFSTEEEREDLLRRAAEAAGVTYDGPIVQASSGMTLIDLESALLEGIARARETGEKTIGIDIIAKAKMELMRKMGYELVYPKLTWKHVGGYETLKKYIQENIINILRDETASKWGVGASRGILFFGPPGTGKTLIAKVMARELELPFIQVSAESLFRSLVGETERMVKTLTKVVEENAPDILFIDELDQLALRRDAVVSTDSGVFRRTQNLLMTYLGDDERRAIVVGATNTPEQLDPAFIRVGRFDVKVPLLWPDRKARVEIFRIHTSVARRIPLKGVSFERLADRTPFWSGAEIEFLCTSAARLARARGDDAVGMEHFDEALADVEINEERRLREFEQFVKQAKEFSSSRTLLRAQIDEFVKREKGERVDRLKALLG